ncbi:MAG: UTP--glucose-1-phosphate uridylyltransferase GalU [Arsenophonus sp.]|nr:MAG: UTP--glucose-1-phosphate uridylyltransferase GalU [Arsenophonus sp.]
MKFKEQKKRVNKVVIPVAGLGTRMLPATKAIPKEMLPLADKPLIQYVVNECIFAGINKIILVTHSSKNSIENHFDTSFELEAILEKRVKRQLLNDVQSICPSNVTIMQTRQGIAKGLGHAILCAKPLVGEEPFAVVLPDVIISQYLSKLKKCNLSMMLMRYYETSFSQVLVESVVLKECISNYGIVDCNNYKLKPGESKIIKGVIEKPSIDKAPSNLSIVGRYVFSEKIWNLLEITKNACGDEIQLTDAIEMLIKHEPVEAYHLQGKCYDCGNKLGYMKAFVEHSMQHESLGHEFSRWIKNMF